MTKTRDANTQAESKPMPDCVCCLPFSGLGDGDKLLERLKDCGSLLLERAASGQTALAEPLIRS